MASQISHIVYARKYFDRLESEGLNDIDKEEVFLIPIKKIRKDEFILGCVFPDIRRIDKNIKRRDTHLRFDPLNLDFSRLNSFEAGWKFHLYCDMKREDILNKYGFYSLPKTNELFSLPAKILEDELLYDEYNNWEKIKSYFNNAPYFDTKIGISPETFGLWYAMVAKYIEKKPDNKSMKIFLGKQNIPHDTNEIIRFSNEIKKSSKALEIIKKVKEEII